MDKPAGPTSHDVVAAVRRALGQRRVGHAGTLDPFATGLLPVLAGRATRLAPWLVGLDKTYEGTIRLGVRTDTDDPEGEEQSRSDAWRTIDDASVAQAMAALTGRLEQVPPAYSAKKIAGTPAHRRVRRGEAVRLAARTVTVYAFEPTGRDGPDVRFAARVSSGTYIRALARDLGETLGCGAHLRTLRRTRVGPHCVDEAVPLADVVTGDVPLRPPLDALRHLPAVPLSPDARDAVRHGRPVPLLGQANGPAALVADGVLLAVAEPADGVWRPRVVLAGS